MFETLEVLHTVSHTDGRIPLSIDIEKQVRVRDDESKTRPFIKLKITIGNRSTYCDLIQAQVLSGLIEDIQPLADAAIQQLAREAREAREKSESRRKRPRRKSDSSGPRNPGATAKRRQLERDGVKKTYEQKKAEKAANDRKIRQQAQGKK
jgi:hypothetical protein